MSFVVTFSTVPVGTSMSALGGVGCGISKLSVPSSPCMNAIRSFLFFIFFNSSTSDAVNWSGISPRMSDKL